MSAEQVELNVAPEPVAHPMNFFSTRHQAQTTNPKHISDAKDIEALLPKGLDTPPKLLDPSTDSPQQICGLPVQLVAGACYCAGCVPKHLCWHRAHVYSLQSASKFELLPCGSTMLDEH